jgi:hypothetical protein
LDLALGQLRIQNPNSVSGRPFDVRPKSPAFKGNPALFNRLVTRPKTPENGAMPQKVRKTTGFSFDLEKGIL